MIRLQPNGRPWSPLALAYGEARRIIRTWPGGEERPFDPEAHANAVARLRQINARIEALRSLAKTAAIPAR